MSAGGTHALFTRALNVVNAAIDAHRDEFPYQQVIEASDRLLGDEDLDVAIYAEDADAPFDHFTVRLRDGRFELVGEGKPQDAKLTWKVSRDYLEDVASDPDRYVEHPERLDLDWLKSRLGID